MNDAERRALTDKAFDFAQDATKQLIALSTGVIALTISFLKDVVKEAPPASQKYIQIAWVLYLISVVFGIATLLSLTGNLGKQESAAKTIYALDTRIASALQIVTFLAALTLTLVFGIKATYISVSRLRGGRGRAPGDPSERSRSRSNG